MDNLQNFHRSHYCGDLRLADAGKTASLCGWVQRCLLYTSDAADEL